MKNNNNNARPSITLLLLCWFLLSLFSNVIDAHLILNTDIEIGAPPISTALVQPGKFPSVAYFHFRFMEVDEYDNGFLFKYRSDDNYTEAVNDIYYFFGGRAAPKVVLVNVSTLEALYEQQQGEHGSSLLQCDFVIMILDEYRTWTSRFRFWWSHSLPLPIQSMMSMSTETASPRYLAVTWKVGQKISTFLESYGNGIVSIDDVSPPTGQDVVAKTCFYGGIVLFLAWWVCKNEDNDYNNANPTQREEVCVTITGSELGLGEIPQDEASHHECVICLESMPPGTIVRILPCRHVYHHDCIVLWLNGNNDKCPLCKFDVRHHLEEQGRADASLDEPRPDSASSRSVSWRDRIRLWPWRRIQVNDNHLLDDDPGDLELTEESTTDAMT